MTLIVSQTNTVRDRLDPFRLVADSPALGLIPGDYPQQLPADPDLGNGREFWLVRRTDSGAFYAQQFGQLVLRIQNDQEKLNG